MLHTSCLVATRCGNLADAAAAIAESDAVIAATGADMGSAVVKALLAVFRGREHEATALIRATEEEAVAAKDSVREKMLQRLAAEAASSAP